MVRGRKPRAQKTNGTASSSSSPSKKLPNNLLVNALFEAHDSAFASPKRKESKIDGVLMENGMGKQLTNGKTRPYRPATRSTRKINEYFAKLPANGIIRVQNGHGSHSEDSCDSIEDDHEIKIVTTENVPPNGSEDLTIPKMLTTTTTNASSGNGPILKPEAHAANTNLFLQEPVMKLEFDKNEAVIGPPSTIKTSFLSTEITTKFQTLPPTEYINKVLNVNGSHESEAVSLSNEQNGFLLNSDSNSSDSGVVIVHGIGNGGGCDSSDGAAIDPNLLKSPLHCSNRQKPTTPHRMILCPSPVKGAPGVHKQTAEIIKASRTKNRARTKLPLPLTSEELVHQDHDYDLKKPQEVSKTLSKPSAAVESNKKVTEFFTVRRSVRKTKKEVQAERLRSLEEAILEGREEGLEVKAFPNKGRGVISTRPFKRGEFVIEYIGDLISIAEANDREVKYAADDNTGCYMYYFRHNEQQYCIDATAETGKLGRLVNHSRNGNLMTKVVMIQKRPHLVLIAKDDLPAGVEMTYDYGDRSKEALQHHPWLAF